MAPRRAEFSRVVASRSHTSLTYREARSRLYSLEHWGIKLGLDNIREFCERLGNPQDKFLSVHIAGTNGKGSTSAYLDSILRAAGYRVGRYTSPHLRDFRERIHINGRAVAPNWVAEFVDRHWDLIVEKKYSYFEVTTALAFDAFAQAKIDIAVVEVGLGGRFDATNVIDPILSIITRIARDHEHVLGHTAGEIAFEKAGIIKTGVSVVIGPLVEEAESRICEIADERMAPVWTAHEILTAGESSQYLPTPKSCLMTPLAGSHQLTNLAIAVASARILDSVGVGIPPEAVPAGVANTRWAARFQIDRGLPTVVYDAGHNPDGARAIVATWGKQFGEQRCACVFNTRPDKNHVEIIESLSAIVYRWIFCPMPDSPYIAREDLLRLASERGQAAEWVDSPSQAIATAKRLAGRKSPVLVTGSHYLVGAIIPQRLIDGRGDRRSQIPISRSQLLAAAQDRGAAF
jgi:dihydrofolate synthase/folylpolyglutamate synthase